MQIDDVERKMFILLTLRQFLRSICSVGLHVVFVLSDFSSSYVDVYLVAYWMTPWSTRLGLELPRHRARLQRARPASAECKEVTKREARIPVRFDRSAKLGNNV